MNLTEGMRANLCLTDLFRQRYLTWDNCRLKKRSYKMNERERILTVLRGERPDMIPWYADLSWWYSAQKEKGSLPEKYDGEEGYLKLHHDVGAGIYLYAPQVWKEEFPSEVQFTETKEGSRTISRIITPAGKLESVSEYLPESYTSAYRSHYIKNPSDLEIMKYVFEKREVVPCYEDFERIDKLWNSAGIPVCLAPICTSALQNLITRWAGVQTTIAFIADEQKKMEETFSFLQDCDDRIFSIIGNSPCTIVEFPENLSGEITGRNFVERYELPYWGKRIKELREKGKFVGIHNDGAVKPTVSLLIKSGFDFIEAVTPSPVGDITLEEIDKSIGARTIVFGGLPGALFSSLYSDKYFEDFVVRAASLFAEKNYILGVADQVPPDAEFSRIRMVREILDRRYNG
jgi:hypothetical protein